MIKFSEWLADQEDYQEGFLSKAFLAGAAMLPSALSGGAEPSANPRPPVNVNMPNDYFKSIHGLEVMSPQAQDRYKRKFITQEINQFMQWKSEQVADNIPPLKITPELLSKHPETNKLPHEVRHYYLGMVENNPKFADDIMAGTWRKDFLGVKKSIDRLTAPRESGTSYQRTKSTLDRLTR